MLRVRELIEQLVLHDPERLVILAKDAEGNSFSPLVESHTAYYLEMTTWSGDIQDEDEHNASSVPCVVLWPTN